MSNTHKYKLEIGDYVFKGECEYTNAGLLSLEETSDEKMSQKVFDIVRQILELLGPLPEKYNDITLFKVYPIDGEE